MTKVIFVVVTMFHAGMLFAPELNAQEPAVVISARSADRLWNIVESAASWWALDKSEEEQALVVQDLAYRAVPYFTNFDRYAPAGVVVWITPEGMPDVLAFLPIQDTTRMLASLEPVIGRAQGKGKVKSITVKGVPLFFKTRGRWTFLATSPNRLKTAPDDPSALLGGLPTRFDVAAHLNVQAIPKALRDQLLEALSGTKIQDGNLEGTPDGKAEPLDDLFVTSENLEDEPSEGPALQTATALQYRGMSKLIAEAEHYVVGLSVDDDNQEFRLDNAYKPSKGTPTRELVDGWQRRRKTRYAGFYRPEAGLQAHVNMSLPAQTVRRWLEDIDEFIPQLAQAREEDPSREGAGLPEPELMLSVLKEFIKHGDLDIAVSLSTEGTPNLLIAAKIADPKNVASVIRMAEVGIAAKSESSVGNRKETVAGVPMTVWTVELPRDEGTQGIRAALGSAIEVAIGLAEDNAYLAIGPSGVLNELARAISKSHVPAHKSSFPAEFVIDGKKLVGGIESSKFGAFGEFLSLFNHLDVPSHIRWAAIPINGGGVHRTQVSSGAFFALSRGFAELGEDAQLNESASTFDDSSVDAPGTP
jgi:hypothetical protein